MRALLPLLLLAALPLAAHGPRPWHGDHRRHSRHHRPLVVVAPPPPPCWEPRPVVVVPSPWRWAPPPPPVHRPRLRLWIGF